jgi:sugar phosphate isomerase/epimerase
VRKIGYQAVQISGVGPIPEEEMVRIFKDEGLEICATHEPADQILNQTDAVIERLNKLGCSLTAYPYPSGVDFGDPAQVESLIHQLDAAGARLREAGLVLGYHNHAIEFVKYQGAPVLDAIFAKTDPQNVVAELDTFWVHYGGGDVVDYCQRLRGRMPFIHLKDYGFSLEGKHHFCEIGNGTLPFDRIINEAEASGCQWFIVEQDTCPADPFDSIKISFDYIQANLAANP